MKLLRLKPLDPVLERKIVRATVRVLVIVGAVVVVVLLVAVIAFALGAICRIAHEAWRLAWR